MKKSFKFLILSTILSLAFVSCDNGNSTDKSVDKISKEGSVETLLNVEHLNDSTDVLKTSHKIWRNGILVKEKLYFDTIPSLEVALDFVNDEKGEEQSVVKKKDYEIYITVQ